MFEFFAAEYGFTPGYILNEMTLPQIALYFDKAIKRHERMMGEDARPVDLSGGIDIVKTNKGFLSDFGIGFRES